MSAVSVSNLDSFLFEQEGALAKVIFNRPAKRNGLDLQVMLEFERIVHYVRDAGDIKVLVLAGNGKAFCAGADITLLRDAATDEKRAQVQTDMARLPRVLGRVFDVMTHMDVVSIAAVNGYAIGGGWTIALACDHVVAAADAQFWLPEVEMGTAFRGLASVKLTHALGPALAKEAMILGRRFSGEELARLHLVNQACEPAELEAQARKTAEAYLALPWRAVVSTRRDIQANLFGPQHF